MNSSTLTIGTFYRWVYNCKDSWLHMFLCVWALLTLIKLVHNIKLFNNSIKFSLKLLQWKWLFSVVVWLSKIRDSAVLIKCFVKKIVELRHSSSSMNWKPPNLLSSSFMLGIAWNFIKSLSMPSILAFLYFSFSSSLNSASLMPKFHFRDCIVLRCQWQFLWIYYNHWLNINKLYSENKTSSYVYFLNIPTQWHI